ncbi:MAG: hypothetical protein ACYSX1_13515, partial [Planctomycetota bacterium]
RRISNKKLQYLKRILTTYAANDPNSTYPDRLEQIKPYDVDGELNWLLANIEYLGKGKMLAETSQKVLAYDKTLLGKAGRTNVLFNDGPVQYCNPDWLKKLGITGKGRLLPGSSLSIENALQTPQFIFVAVCEAVDEGLHVQDEDGGVWEGLQKFKVLEVLAGDESNSGKEIRVSYPYFDHPGLRERPIRQGERVIWIAHKSQAPQYNGPKALADTSENRQTINVAFRLSKLVLGADRIIVTTVPSDWSGRATESRIYVKALETIKGDHRNEGIPITLSKENKRLDTATERRWLLFLREEGHGRSLPDLYPVSSEGWSMPYSEQLVGDIREAIPPPQEWGQPINGLKIGLRLRKDRFQLGEPIPVEVHINNQSQKPLTILQHRYNIYDYFECTRFEVTTPLGKTLTLAKPATVFREADSPLPRTLQPGQTYVRTVYVHNWPTEEHPLGGASRKTFGVFVHPGKYSVRCIYENPHPAEDRLFWTGKLISNDVRLEIASAPTKAPDNERFLPGSTMSVEGEELWGEPVDGVQVRLRCDRRRWHVNENITWKIDVRRTTSSPVRSTAISPSWSGVAGRSKSIRSTCSPASTWSSSPLPSVHPGTTAVIRSR